MRNVVMVAVSLSLLIATEGASFAGDSNLTSKAAATQADTAVNRTSTPAAATSSQNQTGRVKPFQGGVVGGVTPPPPGAAAGRPASAWTLDERLANRCDPVKAAERVRGARVRTELSTQWFSSTNAADVISGRIHPELFLPHELFQQVVRGAAFDPGYQLVFNRRVREAGLPPDFWVRLEMLSAEYVNDLREQRNRASDKSVSGRALEIAGRAALERQICHDRALALRAARAAFGPALDHFMYEYIAPDTTAQFDEFPDERTLRSRERGCQ